LNKIIAHGISSFVSRENMTSPVFRPMKSAWPPGNTTLIAVSLPLLSERISMLKVPGGLSTSGLIWIIVGAAVKEACAAGGAVAAIVKKVLPIVVNMVETKK
jgi:hypothetical protein